MPQKSSKLDLDLITYAGRMRDALNHLAIMFEDIRTGIDILEHEAAMAHLGALRLEGVHRADMRQAAERIRWHTLHLRSLAVNASHVVAEASGD